MRLLVSIAVVLQVSMTLGSRPPPPVVKLDDAIITGTTDGVVDRFLGIPFAKPP